MSFPTTKKNRDIIDKYLKGEKTVIDDNKKDILKVNEIFSTIQCEGTSMGKPVVFIRLYGCNLKCGFANPCGEKGCDTPYTWKAAATTTSDNLPYTPEMIVDEVMQYPTHGHWVITGGEPLIQSRKLEKVIKEYEKRTGKTPYIEIETNGTIIPSKDLHKKVGHFNVSVKLENSNATEETGYSKEDEEYNWNTRERRIIARPLKFFTEDEKSYFKFVIDTKRKVLKEVQQLQKEFNIPNNKVWLMPEGNSPSDINKNSDPIIEICKAQGYSFSTRLHILIWGYERGK